MENLLKKRTLILKFSLVLLLGFSFASCTPQRRLQRLLEKHPELTVSDTVKIDTVLIDTVEVMIPGVATEIDVPCDSLQTDTVYIDTAQLHLKLWNEGGSIKGTASCDTVYKTTVVEIPFKTVIPVEKIIYQKQKPIFWLCFGLFILGGLFMFLWLKLKRFIPGT